MGLSAFLPILGSVSRYLAAREENWDEKKADSLLKDMGELDEKIRKEYRKFILFRDAAAIVDWELELLVLTSRFQALVAGIERASTVLPSR